MQPINDRHENRQLPESIDEQIERLEIRNEAGMRRDRLRLVLDIVKWSVIGAAVVLAYIAASHVGVV